MRFRLALLVTHLFVGAAFGQGGVVLLNALDEGTSCVTSAASQPVETVCQGQEGLRLGRTPHLLVLHRRFLTNYRVEIGQTADVGTAPSVGGEVRAVPSANQVPVPQSRPSLERKTALDFLDQLVDVTSSSEPAAEIERENQVLDLALRRIQLDMATFNSQYALVVGDGPKQACDLWQGRRDGFWLEACLRAAYGYATSATNEPTFRVLVGRSDELFHNARIFSAELAEANLVSKAGTLEDAIVSYEDDLRIFKANLASAVDAVSVVQQLQGPGESVFSLQIRELLRRRLAVLGTIPGSSKPALDEAETNLLIDRYLQLLSEDQGLPQFWRDRLTTTITNVGQNSTGIKSLANSLTEIHTKADFQLPALVLAINDWQDRLAARVDDIFQRSDVPTTLSNFNLSPIPSNGVVSYRITRTNEFQPYVFRPTASSATAMAKVEVSRGVFAVDDKGSGPKRTLWQILRFTH